MRRLPLFAQIILAYLLVAAAAMVARPAVFTNYFIEPKVFFDVVHYVDIALTGYNDKALAAFYPLWPLLIKVLTIFTQSREALFLASGILAFVLFLATLQPMQRLLQTSMLPAAAWAWTSLYALNPNSFFHAVGYSESLCSLLILFYLYSTWQHLEGKKQAFIWMVFLTAVALSLSRPVLPVVFVCVVTAGILRVLVTGHSELKRTFRHAAASIAGFFAGYSIFGYVNRLRFDSFWQPFHAQAYWGREFGLHWHLIHSPSSVSGSDNILVWDLQGFYVPIAVVLLGAVLLWLRRVRPSEKIEAVCRSYLFWFCAVFAFCHSMIAFLTYDKFMSLGRHVWGTPPVFVAIAILAQALPQNKFSKYFFRFYLFASCVYLAIFWARLARMSWIG